MIYIDRDTGVLGCTVLYSFFFLKAMFRAAFEMAEIDKMGS